MADIVTLQGAGGLPASWPDQVIAAHGTAGTDPVLLVEPATVQLRSLTSIVGGDVAVLLFDWPDDAESPDRTQLVEWWTQQAPAPLVAVTGPVDLSQTGGIARYEVTMLAPPSDPLHPQPEPVKGQPCLRRAAH